ncbi:MAG: nitroreductase family deazaflavin-dependent oxidoreductase [Candidatus Binataceae bacterium]
MARDASAGSGGEKGFARRIRDIRSWKERPTQATWENKMSERNDFNQVISEFRTNEGKVGGQMKGVPLLLLTTTGAQTGKPFTKPLAYTKDGERIVVIASFAGSQRHPAWYDNLVKNPVVTIEIGSERFRAHATATSGAERQRLFDAQAKLLPVFNDYQKKTSREIPVVVLERMN